MHDSVEIAYRGDSYRHQVRELFLSAYAAGLAVDSMYVRATPGGPVPENPASTVWFA